MPGEQIAYGSYRDQLHLGLGMEIIFFDTDGSR
jgi:hypothetical protein